MAENGSPSADFPYSSGLTLVEVLYRSVSGKSECIDLAKNIVESLDRDALIKYISEILYGIEVIKNSERGKEFQYSLPHTISESLQAIKAILEHLVMEKKQVEDKSYPPIHP